MLTGRRSLVALLLAAACSSNGEGDPGGSGGSASASAATGIPGTGASGAGGGGASSEPIGGSVGPPDIDPGPESHGGTITFEAIGAPGWYPSRRDPAVGPCDAYDTASCCLAQETVEGDALTPWNEELIMSLRGPLQVEQLAVYQPGGAASWNLVSAWTAARPDGAQGVAFHGNGTEAAGFDGKIGTECLVDVSTDEVFPCGPGSVPYCPEGEAKHWGWSGSKLMVMLATAPPADQAGPPCSDGPGGNWYDAPWIGLSLGELVRAGAFSGCHCYAKNPDEWFLGDGCGQFNVFEVVNDNNRFTNLGVFSTNFFGYAGYVGEGPCGTQCDTSVLADDVDLIDKASNSEATAGAVASPDQGPGAAFRRPLSGYRYFVMLLDAPSRTVQLALIHPSVVPSSIAALLPSLPATVDVATIDAFRALRLPM